MAQTTELVVRSTLITLLNRKCIPLLSHIAWLQHFPGSCPPLYISAFPYSATTMSVHILCLWMHAISETVRVFDHGSGFSLAFLGLPGLPLSAPGV